MVKQYELQHCLTIGGGATSHRDVLKLEDLTEK